MPSFEIDVDIEEIMSSCSKRELNQLIEEMVEECVDNSEMRSTLKKSLDAKFPSGEIRLKREEMSYDQEEFLSSLEALANRYYSLDQDVIDTINSKAKKYL
jgi:hypothetical protein